MTEDVPVVAWLEKPFWPWPLALAYSQAPDVREAALWAAIEVLEEYPKLGSMAAYTGGSAVHRVYEMMTGQQGVGQLQETTLRGIEADLIAAIASGRVSTFGRATPASLPEKIDVTAWIGGEIDGDATCDLVKAGWREKALSDFGAWLDEIERVVWFYDVHLPRAEMIAAFGDVQPPREDAREEPAAILTMATAGGIRDCEAWLRAQFKDPSTSARSKSDFGAEALQLFEGRLSDRGFKNAWSKAVKDHPERARAGPKRKSAGV